MKSNKTNGKANTRSGLDDTNYDNMNAVLAAMGASMPMTGRSSAVPRLIPAAEKRLELGILKTLQSLDGAELDAIFEDMGVGDSLSEAEIALIRCNLLKVEGNALYSIQKYEAAIAAYMSAMRAIVGEDAVLPSNDGLNPFYAGLDFSKDWREFVDLTACCGNISQSYFKQDKFLEVLSIAPQVPRC